MGREKSAAMLPEPGPDAFAVGVRQLEIRQRRAREEFKAPLAMRGGQFHQARLHLKEKHQPVGVALETVLAHEAGQVQIARLDFEREFLMRFAARANVGRLAIVRVQLAAGRAPQPAIRLLRAFEQQHFVALVEAIKQRGDFIRQLHFPMQ